MPAEPEPAHGVSAAEKIPETANKEPLTPSAQEKEMPAESGPESAVSAAEKAAVTAGKDISAPSAQIKDEPIAKPETADGRARLQARWQRQMEDTGFDIQGVMNEAREREMSRAEAGEVQDAPVPAMEAAAMLQKSRSGEVVLVSDLTQGMVAAREKPKAGVLIMHGRQIPSAQLLKVAGGNLEELRRPDATLLSQVKDELQEILAVLPRTEREQDEQATLHSAIKSVSNGNLMEKTSLPAVPPGQDEIDKVTLAVQLAARVAEIMAQKLPRLPGESQPDYSALVRQAARTLADTPDASADAAVRAVLGALSVSGIPDSVRQAATAGSDGVAPAVVVRQVQEELNRSRSAVKTAQPEIPSAALASAARELDRQAQVSLPPEARGREPERELPGPEITRHIQKER